MSFGTIPRNFIIATLASTKGGGRLGRQNRQSHHRGRKVRTDQQHHLSLRHAALGQLFVLCGVARVRSILVDKN
jgi:hypothetical protein